MLHTFTHGFTLAYRTYGNGPLPVVAFHGFGRTGEDFAFLEAYWGERCTLYAFDLPFHGVSPSPEDRIREPFHPQEFAAYFAAFANHIGVQRFTAMGYSLGGRMALCLLERIPERIAKAFLLAPDGLKHQPWYRGLAASGVGRAAYAHFIDHPRPVHGLVQGLRATRLLNERLALFIVAQSDTRVKRHLLRSVWLSLRRIEPELLQVAANANAQPFTVQLVFGARDRVIKPEFAERLQALAPDQVRVQLIPTGHLLLIPELGEWLAREEPA